MALRTFVTLIGTGSLTTAMLADDAVTAAKVADGAIDAAAKVGTGVITAAALDTSDDFNFTGSLELNGAAVATGGAQLYYAVVDAASTGNLNVAAAPSALDGVSLTDGMDVLVWAQTTTTQNGIYNVDAAGSGSNGSWSRPADRDAAAELPPGLLVYVKGGTLHGEKLLKCTASGTVGSAAITFEVHEEGLAPGGTRGAEVFAGDGSTTTFDLQAASPAYVAVLVDGIEQTGGGVNYSYAGTGGSGGVARITMTAAPASGAVVSVYTLYRS